MGVDTAPCSAQIERVPEEGSACGFFEIERWSSEEDAITVRGGEGQHEDVRRQNALFLHARRGYVDFISLGKIDRGFYMSRTMTAHPTRMLMPPPVPVTQPK
jgi:hypothetical protein